MWEHLSPNATTSGCLTAEISKRDLGLQLMGHLVMSAGQPRDLSAVVFVLVAKYRI